MAKATKGEAGHGAHGHAHVDDHGAHGGGGHDDHGGGGHCPPPWIITFADMATLLMAFFVIMLMTAQTDTPKFNAFAAVMRQTFGRVPLDPNDADKGGTSILDLHFGPQSGDPTDELPGGRTQSGDPKTPANNNKDGSTEPQDPAGQAAEALAKAMRDAVAQGELTVQSDAGQVVVRLPSGASPEDAQKIADALAAAAGTEATSTGAATGNAAGDAAGTSGAGPAGVGAAGAGAEGAGAAGAGADAPTDAGKSGADGTDGSTGAPATEGQGAAALPAPDGATAGEAAAAGGTVGGTAAAAAAGVGGTGREQMRAKLAALEAQILLADEMGNGSVSVEQRDGSMVVTIGAGGAFASGSADITPEAQAIIADLEQVSGKAKRIVITGHTDNVPLSGSTYADNWDLAAARASTVLREIKDAGLLADAELVAQSMGDTKPVADNSTAEGREKNRRIEIEIEFASE